MSTITCLIIDDEVKLAKSLSFALHQAQINCLEAYDGESGFKMASSERPDIILLDVMLPDMDGIEILKKIRNSENYSELPVIMLTAKNEELDKVLGLEFGADDYITKPFSPMELVARIKAILRNDLYQLVYKK